MQRQIEKPKVITICGSTKFKNEHLREMNRLTLEGNIVLGCIFLEQSESEDRTVTESKHKLLEYIHKRKVDISDAIFVVNPGGYIGMSTISEIVYAAKNGKEVIYMEPGKEAGSVKIDFRLADARY